MEGVGMTRTDGGARLQDGLQLSSALLLVQEAEVFEMDPKTGPF